MYQIMEAHGPTNEVTCCAVNGRGTKMVSGAADGLFVYSLFKSTWKTNHFFNNIRFHPVNFFFEICRFP